MEFHDLNPVIGDKIVISLKEMGRSSQENLEIDGGHRIYLGFNNQNGDTMEYNHTVSVCVCVDT